MSEPDTTDTTILTGSAYRDDRHLAARQSLYRWQQPTYDLPGLVLEHLPIRTGTVLDVGCGNGTYVTRLRSQRPGLTVVGLDISPGILATVSAPVVAADAARLPVGDHSATAVLAMHTLYHVDNIDAAVAEAVRVLEPGGIFIASTNAREDKAELDDLWARAAGEVLGVDRGPRRISLSTRFALNDAPQRLRSHFAAVETVELPGTITVHEPEPVIAHLASYRSWAENIGVPFDATLTRARDLLQHMIDRDGRFQITCRGGILLCHTTRHDDKARYDR
ncbi:class I SAM-dependent methyltransferase [Haloechinothrix aidingensis]|uniref:class I SAM-dependent methyltransferase n=1 Tax=Haloechinothrix aidingensis TaxID=2752311 RepID=UPI0031B65063